MAGCRSWGRRRRHWRNAARRGWSTCCRRSRSSPYPRWCPCRCLRRPGNTFPPPPSRARPSRSDRCWQCTDWSPPCSRRCRSSRRRSRRRHSKPWRRERIARRCHTPRTSAWEGRKTASGCRNPCCGSSRPQSMSQSNTPCPIRTDRRPCTLRTHWRHCRPASGWRNCCSSAPHHSRCR